MVPIMLGRIRSDLREAVADIRSDANGHMDRINSSVEHGTDLLVVTLLTVGLIASVALLVAVMGFSGD